MKKIIFILLISACGSNDNEAKIERIEKDAAKN
jgi:hypothetical protein